MVEGMICLSVLVLSVGMYKILNACDAIMEIRDKMNEERKP